MRVAGLVALVAVLVGCGALGANVDKEATSQLGGTARQQQERGPGIAGSAQGDLTLAVGDKALAALKQASESELGLQTGHTWDVSTRNPYSLLAVGLGLIVLSVGLVKMWTLFKSNSIGQAAKLADEAARRQIARLRERMAATTDAGELNALRTVVIDAEAARDEEYARITKAA